MRLPHVPLSGMVTTLAIVAAVASPSFLAAQDDSTETDAKRGLTLAPERTIAFETTEGTYMNLDVSPDGRTIVFDLLGDLYTMAVEGGEAGC